MARNVRQSTCSRRGRHGSGRSPHSASPVTTQRADAGKESGDGGSPESEASGGCSHHSQGHSVPREEPQQVAEPKGEEAISDVGARWHPHSAPSSEHQRVVSPQSMAIRTQGSSPELDTRTDSPTAAALLDCARRHDTFVRETTHRRRQPLNSTCTEWRKRSVRNGRRRRR